VMQARSRFKKILLKTCETVIVLWLDCQTCDQLVANSTPGRALPG